MSYCVLVALLVSMATSSYALKIGDRCNATADCTATITQSNCERKFTYSSCTEGTCSCNTNYLGSICTAATIIKLYGQSCNQNSDCGIGLTCASGACACETYTQTYRSAIVMCLDPAVNVHGEACTQSMQCFNFNKSDGITCSKRCLCATGYVYRSGYCKLPYLGEACAASTGCTTMGLPQLVFTDASRQTETCTSGTCSCPSSTEQYTLSYGGTSYSYCLVITAATLKLDGTNCTLHNECASKICARCPADVAMTKRCLRFNTIGVSGVSGIQATTDVLLVLVALKVTLV